ncbi:hypothetical protein [Clavibacter sp. MX14-G9D]|uniref:hypothetical protein n=1 Tax=Clavibacter sp. MX14-G9D TaxID=3064656 RepID=UPI00293F5B50|nr:hypothetical protein [Clavibacter sp. MX14-G9D]
MDSTTSIRIDGHPFQLADDQDVAELKSRIVAAVTDGSRFVDFSTASQGEVSILVTPRSVVRFEVRERVEEESAGFCDDAPVEDVDLYRFG